MTKHELTMHLRGRFGSGCTKFGAVRASVQLAEEQQQSTGVATSQITAQWTLPCIIAGGLPSSVFASVRRSM